MNALEYNKSRNYPTDVVKRIQHTVGTDADGLWGPNTVAGVRRWQSEHGLTADGKVGPSTLAAIEATPTKSGARSADEGKTPSTITTVGAWIGPTDFGNPANTVGFCRVHGINRIDVVVNDFSKARAPTSFTTFDRKEIIALASAAKSAGIDVHLMSWIMPHQAFIEAAAEQLIPLCRETDASSLMWDAEEPWNEATDALEYTTAAHLVRDKFSGLGRPMGVTGIIYTPADEFGPLAEISDYVVPQCYATSSDGLDPANVVSRAVQRWRSKFVGTQRFIIGLAAYRQTNIQGYTVNQAMNASLTDVRRQCGIDTVIYWSFRQIHANSEVAGVIASISPATEATSSTARVS